MQAALDRTHHVPTWKIALQRFAGRTPISAALRPVAEVGLGYLGLGEPTPSLSRGESQRLRIASRLRTSQRGSLCVFDEPSTGLHPLDVATRIGVFVRLTQAGATVIVIDHDLDLLAAADHLLDMGPGRRHRRRAHPGGRHPRGCRPHPGQRERAMTGRLPRHPRRPRARPAISTSELMSSAKSRCRSVILAYTRR